VKNLTLQDIRARLSKWLDPSEVSHTFQVVALPFGNLGTTEAVPVVSSESEVTHGNDINAVAGSIITRRQGLAPGVYDVWWNFSLRTAVAAVMLVQVEDSGGNLRWGTGFVCGDSIDGGQSMSRIAFMTVDPDDQIVFRNENTVVGTLDFNTAIVQRLP